LRLDKDLMPSPPSLIGEQTVCQETVIIFLDSKSPFQMKFLIYFSSSLINLTGDDRNFYGRNLTPMCSLLLPKMSYIDLSHVITLKKTSIMHVY
jgi:hypothetical protein